MVASPSPFHQRLIELANILPYQARTFRTSLSSPPTSSLSPALWAVIKILLASQLYTHVDDVKGVLRLRDWSIDLTLRTIDGHGKLDKLWRSSIWRPGSSARVTSIYLHCERESSSTFYAWKQIESNSEASKRKGPFAAGKPTVWTVS